MSSSIHIEIQGRPRDKIEQWLLSVPEPEGDIYDNLINRSTSLGHHNHKSSRPSKEQGSKSLNGLLKETLQPSIPPRKTDLFTSPQIDNEGPQDVKRKRSSLENMSNHSNTKRGFKEFGRRPRHKTREDKYEPKKKKGKSITKNRKKSQDDVQKTKTSKRPIRRSTTSIESNFKPANIAQGRLTLNNNLGKGLFARGKTSNSVGRLGLPDLSFTDMGYLSKNKRSENGRNEIPSLKAYDDRSTASTIRKSIPDGISRFFSEPHHLTRDKASTKQAPPENCSLNRPSPRQVSATPFRTPSTHRKSLTIPRTIESQQPSHRSESRHKEANDKAPLRSESATVVYSWSPTVASGSARQRQRQRSSIKESPVQADILSARTKSTPRSTPSLNSSLLSRTRKKLFHNIFVGEEVSDNSSNGRVNYTLEQLQEISRQLSASPHDHHEVIDLTETAEEPVSCNKQEKADTPGIEERPLGEASSLQQTTHSTQEDLVDGEKSLANGQPQVPLQSGSQKTDHTPSLPMNTAKEEDLQRRLWGRRCSRDSIGSYTHPPASVYPIIQPSMSPLKTMTYQSGMPGDTQSVTHGTDYMEPFELPVENNRVSDTTQGGFDEGGNMIDVNDMGTPDILDNLMDVSMSPSDLQLLNQVLGEPNCRNDSCFASDMQCCSDDQAYLDGESQNEAHDLCNQACYGNVNGILQGGDEVVSDPVVRERVTAPFGFWRPNKLY